MSSVKCGRKIKHTEEEKSIGFHIESSEALLRVVLRLEQLNHFEVIHLFIILANDYVCVL